MHLATLSPGPHCVCVKDPSCACAPHVLPKHDTGLVLRPHRLTTVSVG